MVGRSDIRYLLSLPGRYGYTMGRCVRQIWEEAYNLDWTGQYYDYHVDMGLLDESAYGNDGACSAGLGKWECGHIENNCG